MKLVTLLVPTLFISQLAMGQAKTVADGSYKIDPAHSKVGFEIAHLVVSTVEGKFTDFDGMIVVDKKLEKSKVDLTIKAASIDTSNADRDKHLKSADFFDTAKFDKLTFKSKKISGTPEDLKVEGDLTMHGVTKPITLTGKYTGAVKDPWGNDRIAFKATAKLNRQDFGLKWTKAVEMGPVVGDEVTLDLKVEAIKEKAK
jgi:polyisoprenoid-binding protein YceI